MTIVRDGSRRLIFAVLLAAFAMGSTGCESAPKGPRRDLECPWWPASMRIVDLTRVGRPDADGVRPIEVRILFPGRVMQNLGTRRFRGCTSCLMRHGADAKSKK